MTDQRTRTNGKARRPVEAIEHRTRTKRRMRAAGAKALTKLTKTGAPFTVENVCDLAGVGKTFIYDKRHPELTKRFSHARDASQVTTTSRAEEHIDEDTASWRERALNAEAIAKTLRAAVKERDARIADLTGQLYDPDGTHLADENARLRDLVLTLNRNLQQAQLESSRLRRSLDGARANVKRERASSGGATPISRCPRAGGLSPLSMSPAPPTPYCRPPWTKLYSAKLLCSRSPPGNPNRARPVKTTVTPTFGQSSTGTSMRPKTTMLTSRCAPCRCPTFFRTCWSRAQPPISWSSLAQTTRSWSPKSLGRRPERFSAIPTARL